MKTIRTCVFETNSSSTHVMSICSEKKYNDFFEKHIGLWSTDRDCILTFEEVLKELKADYSKDYVQQHFKSSIIGDYVPDPDKIFTLQNIEKVMSNYACIEEAYDNDDSIEGVDNDEHALLWFLSDGYQTADEWAEYDWIEEVFDSSYTTENGESVVAFGYYGRG